MKSGFRDFRDFRVSRLEDSLKCTLMLRHRAPGLLWWNAWLPNLDHPGIFFTRMLDCLDSARSAD
jgi:hypothetical protein